ncbi:3-ketodihydrosphingosine reductase related [Cystoisospora suis]|uniref:3-ketodihydrosphingosine reductase related n=1 Tax=Cystoisospora suis TaxID=483139 RepID=A0A2C6KZM5_9APIC|nr:3-ketodihydrosphingosine reductase related [Cystoisospora suis]
MDRGSSIVALAFATVFCVSFACSASIRLVLSCFSLLLTVVSVVYCIQKSVVRLPGCFSANAANTDTLKADKLSYVSEGVRLFSSLPQHSKKQPFALKGRHVLITGGSKGVGLSLALACVRRRPALLSLLARSAAGLHEAQKKCVNQASEAGISIAVQTVQADLSDITAVERALRGAMNLQVVDREKSTSTGDVVFCGDANVNSITNAAVPSTSGHNSDWPLRPVDVFFCNAAAVEPKTLTAMNLSDISSVVNMNVTSIILQVKAVLHYMQQQNFGAVCFSNSLAAFVPIYGLSVYSATKAALPAFATAIEQEMANSDILIANAYLPSVDTPGFKHEKEVRPQVTGLLEGVIDVQKPEIVAESIVAAVEKGRRIITVCSAGWLLARCSAVFAFANSFADLLFEVFASGLVRLYLVWLRTSFQHTSRRETRKAVGSRLELKTNQGSGTGTQNKE